MEHAIAANPRIAFERMALSHRDNLFHYALSLTRDRFVSEDLVQETYLKALRAFSLFRSDSNCLAWLSKIMLNTFINNYNRNKRSPLAYGLDAIQYEPAAETDSHVEFNNTDSLYYFTSDEIKAAIQSLPADYRNIIIFSDMMGLSYREISYLSGSPMGTVRSRLSRARYMLKRRLFKAGYCSMN
jgi:RNA polymerase sigma-70 factor (ECF subfamily)